MEATGRLPLGNPLQVLLVEDSAILAARLEELLGSVSEVELTGVVDTEKSAIESIAQYPAEVVV